MYSADGHAALLAYLHRSPGAETLGEMGVLADGVSSYISLPWS